MRKIRLKNNFLNTSQQNLTPLTELTIYKDYCTNSLICHLKCGGNWRQAFEVTEPRTSELVNRVFSRQTGIRNASIHFRLIKRWSKPMSLLSKAHGYEAWVRNCIQATSSTCCYLCYSIDAKSC